jgi:Asp-tRNA(Asn)/Glu-tRNA(Gln) amidotransferase C subunit
MAHLTLELMGRIAALAGFAWTDEELRAVAPQVERSLDALHTLDELPLQDAEPSTVFHPG